MFNFEEFDKEWTEVAKEISKTILADQEIKKLQESLKKNGFLSLEEKSSFINLSDRIKYEVIYKKYGGPDTDGYKQFSHAWAEWFKVKGVGSQRNHGHVHNSDHILFGSTPDPVKFLTDQD